MIVTKTLGAGITQDEDGFQVRLESYDTSGLVPALHCFYYDLEVLTAAGDTTTIFSGPIYIFPDVTYA